MKYLALLSSVPFESDEILSRLKAVRKTEIAGKSVYRGKLSGLNLLMTNTGIGKANAAHCATGIIELFPVNYIVNFGVGGAYPRSGLKVGDIAIALKEIYGDEGVITSEGWRGMKETGIPLVKSGKKQYFNEFSLDKKLAQKALNSITSLLKVDTNRFRGGREDFQIKSGNFLTVSTVTGTQKRALELEKRFHVICENMEGASLAQICTIYNIPMLEIRGISNIVGVRDKSKLLRNFPEGTKWDLRGASNNCQEVLLNILKSLV